MLKGRVIAVKISETKGLPKTTKSEGNFIKNFGLEGDAHGGNWHRQVSLLSNESVKKMRELGVEGICTGRFAENITTEGIELCRLSVGAKLKIGKSIHEVTQIGKECHQGCAIKHQVGQCIMPKQGIFTRVLKGGKVTCNDEIILLD